MTEKKPVGVLGWTDAELAQHARTEEWPWRVAEEPSQPPGFSLNGLAKAALPTPSPEVLACRQAEHEALRELWRAAVLPEALRNARAELARSAGKTKRRAKPWRQHAIELATGSSAENPKASDSVIARDVDARWKLKSPDCPSHRTLERLISKMRSDGALPKRSTT